MMPLVTIQRALMWRCAFIDDKPVSVWKRCAFIMFSLTILSANVTGITSSSIFVWKYLSIDLEQSLSALYQVFGGAAIPYVLLIGILMRHKITATIKRLSEIYNENKAEDSFRYLEQANNKSEWLCRAFFIYIVVGFAISTVATSFFSVVVCVLINGHFDVKKVQHPFKLILPWNQSTPLGYIGEICYSIYITEAHFITNGTFILLFISICLHHQAFSKMFDYTLKRLDRSEKNGKNKKILRKLIHFHVSVKDWFLESTKIYSPSLLVEMICNAGFLACCVFELDMYIKHADFFIFVTLVGILTSMSGLFLYCFFGKLATESFLEMGDSLYNANWYELPVAMQKHFNLMIENTQLPLYYHGFNMAILNLETFLKLIRAVYTYYALFKTITT